jgi:hypothetical protein
MTTNKTIKLLMAGVLALGVTAMTTGCGNRELTTLPPTEAEKPKDIGTVTITVIDNNSKPVSGAAVSLKDKDGKAVGSDVATGEDGVAVFKQVNIATGYTASVEHDGVTASQGNLGVDGEEPVVVRLMLIPPNGSKGTVSGTVVNGMNGQPLDGATVSILGTQSTVTTRADGSFTLKDVPAGNPTVVAIARSFREGRTAVALKGGKLETCQVKIYPVANGARYGNTVITTANAIVEIDKLLNPVKSTKRGATQARTLENGNLLVSNSAGVVELNESNMVVWSYRPLLFGNLGNPQGVSKTKSGNILIADTENGRVVEVSPSHKIQKTIKFRFNRPMSVDRVDATSTTLVADTGNNRVIEVADNGVITWGVTEKLNHPAFAQRLANGNTLIADTGNHRVMEVNKAQQLVWMYGGDGARGTCYLPNAATRLANGNTLIADTGNDRVIEVNAKGAIVWQAAAEQPLFAERL